MTEIKRDVKEERMMHNEILKFWKFLDHKEETELRAIVYPPTGSPNDSHSHHFSTEEKLIKLCEQYNGKRNLYLGMNERIKGGRDSEQVKEVKIIPVDIDSVNKPATDEDINEANLIVTQIVKDAIKQGFKQPSVLFSGNGFQIYFKIPPIQLTNENRAEIETKLQAFQEILIKKYSNNRVKLDKVGDLSRIMRLAGTMNIRSKSYSKFVIYNPNVEDERLKEHILELDVIKDIKDTSSKIVSVELLDKIKQDERLTKLYHADPTITKDFKSRSESELSLVCGLVKLGLTQAELFHVMSGCKIGKWQSANLHYRNLTYTKAIRIITKEKGLIKHSEKIGEIKTRRDFTELQKNIHSQLALKDRDSATELIVNEIKSRYNLFTLRDDNKPEMWVYQDGIYVPHGKSLIREIVREILGEAYNTFLKNIVIDKIMGDTQIEPMDFFQTKTPIEEIPIQQGIFNLLTYEIKPFSPDKIFFNKLPLNYNPDATCPMIDQHLKTVLKSEDDVKVMYEIFGYLLWKDYFIEKAVMMVGNGRNGKGKTIELMKRFIGVENCSSVALSSLNSHSFRVSELFGKMANICGDLSQTSLKDTGLFKEITGRDLIGASRKFMTDLVFTNYAKLTFACNELPRVYDSSDGFWDRWVLFEFPYKFVPKKIYDTLDKKEIKGKKIMDADLIEKMSTQEELDGLFLKALEGLQRLLKNKDFSYSVGTNEIKQFWMRRADSFMAFALDNLEADDNHEMSKRDIRKFFSKYCKEHKIKGVSDKNIKIVLEEMFGATESRMSDDRRTWVWEGIKLKQNSKYNFENGNLKSNI